MAEKIVKGEFYKKASIKERMEHIIIHGWMQLKKDIMYMLKHCRNCEKKNRNYKRIF